MAAIILYRPDGVVIWDSSKSKQEWEGTCYRSIMGGSTLQLTLESVEPLEIPIRSYIDYEGYRYTLYYPTAITKTHTKKLEYQLLLHGEEELLKLYKLKDVAGGKPYRLKFFLTAKPIDYLRLMVATLNLSDEGWQVGDCIDAGEKTIAFNHEDCLSVLSRVSKEFDTEWEIKGKTISLGKVSYFKDDPLPLQYGFGKGFRSGVARRNDGDRMPIGRLYVEGGSRNIDRKKYGSPTLLLPRSTTIEYDGHAYRTDPDGMYVEVVSQKSEIKSIAEGSYDGSDVYPMREGRVTEAIEVKEGEATFYDIIDTTIPEELDYSQYRIAGEKATIVFQSGALAGRELDLEQSENQLTGYIHAERRFKIVPAEIDGFEMPGGTFVPAMGDKYVIFHISLPDQYLANASKRMLEDSVKYLSEQIHPTFIFDGEVDPVHTRDQWLEIGGRFVPGGHILFSDPQFHPEGSVIRIIAVKTPIGEPYQPELTLSNAPLSGSFASTLGKLEAESVLAEERERGLRQYTKRYWQDAKESQNMLLKAMGALGDEFTSTLSPVALQTMQVLVGSAALQYRFVTSKAAPATANHLITWNKVGASLDVQAGIIQHRTLGIDTITFNRKPSDFRYWDLPRYKSPALTNQLTPYYLYAKVEKNGTAGAFELDDKARPFESASHFNLLVGLLSSEREGMRSFAPMYSYSELTPDGLTTRLIKSLDGSTYFDLERGEIGGNILFRGGSLEEWAEDTEDAVAKSGYQIHCPFTEVFSVYNDSAGYGACKCSPKLYKYSNELPIDISKLRVFRKGWASDGTILNHGKDYELEPLTNSPTNRDYFIDDYYHEPQSLYGIQLDVIYAEAWETINEAPYTTKPVNILATNSYTYYHVQDGKKGEDGKDAHSLLFTISLNGEVRNGEVSNIWHPELTVMYDGNEIIDYEMVLVEWRISDDDSWHDDALWDDLSHSFELDIIDNSYIDGVHLHVRIHYRGLTATNSVYIPNTKDGTDGADGVSITGVVNYYLASANGSGVTTATQGWTNSIQTMTAEKPYLWNYEVISYTKGTPTTTSPVIIGRWSEDGLPGRGISSIVEYYQVSTSNTVPPSNWVTNVVTTTTTYRYLWNYEKIIYSDGTREETAKRVIGTHGATGTNGVSVTKVDAEFAKNSTPGTAPSSGWQTTAPTITGNEQLWTRTKTVYSSGNPTYTSPVNITPKRGNDGRSADIITEEYAISTSKTVQPTTGWSTSQPTWEPGKYIWSRVKIEYSNPDGTEYTGYAVSSEWEAINELQIGGRNLILGSATPITITAPDTGKATDNFKYYTFVDTVKSEGVYTFSADVEVLVGTVNRITVYMYKPGSWGTSATVPIINGRIEATIMSGAGTKTYPTNVIVYAGQSGNTRGNSIRLSRYKLEKGNKATDWTEAPEDVEARRKESEERLQTAINQQKYITRAIRDGSTNIHGGLVLTNMIAVKDTPHGGEVISKEEVFSGFSMNGQDLPLADMESKYQLGVNDVTPPTGTWVVTPTNPTSARPVLWAKLFIGYQDDEYYSSEVKIPVAYYYQDNPVVSVTPQLHFSDDGTWQPMNWFASNLSMGGYVRGRAVVKYTKPIEGNIVGYMSALGGDMPFIGAGVKNFRGKGGAPESRLVEIWQNGRFKFADLRYNPQNNELEWVTNGEPYMTHGGTPLSIAQLQAQAGETVRTIASFSVNSSGIHTLPNSALTLTKEGGEFKFSTRLVATATIAGDGFLGDVRDDYIDYVEGNCTVSLFLRRTHGSQIIIYALGSSVIATASANVQQRYMDDERFDVEFYWGSTSSSTDVTIEDRLTNLPVGSYDLYLSLGYSGDGIATVSGSVQITNLRGVMYDSPNINYIRYTSRGMMAYYGISKHFVIDKDDPKAFLTLKGATDLPGVLAGGRCDSYGTVNYQWGRYADAQGYTKARVEKIAYGKYKVHHSIGHTRYTPQVTVENVGSLASANFTDVRETYFVVMIYGTNGLRDAAFSYNCVGENA